jgi:diguanylate cyclase
MPIEKTDKSAFIAQQVMNRIGQFSLVPNPPVFAVLYAHYSGLHPEISQMIDKLDREKKALTTSECENLFDKFLSHKSEKAFVEEAGRRVQAMASEIATMVRDAGIVHKEYNQTLMRQSDNLSNSTDMNEVKKLVASLVDDTRAMIEKNQKLEEKLHSSSSELQQMRQDMQNLRHEALTDTLTGIPNRKSFDVELKTRASEALSKAKPLSLMMIDIDYFKVFNDTFGHQVGDQVLRLVAKTISDTLRPTELLARYGGEEFAVIVGGAKIKDAEKLAEKIRERIATKDIINQSKNEKLGRLSVSIGVSQLEPGEPLIQLIDRADRALYKAKAAGRNTVIAIEYDKNLHGQHGDIVIDVNR